MSRFVALVLAGLSLGAVYALVASGIVLVHKATGAVNFAQGDLLALGAYVYLWLTQHSLAAIPACLIAMVVLFGVGSAIERVVFVPLRSKPRLTVAVATFGIALGIEASLTIWKGSDPKVVPSAFGVGSVGFLGAHVPVLSLWTIAITVVVFVLLYALFQFTQMGRMVRALASDQEVAVMYGVPSSMLNFLTFGLPAPWPPSAVCCFAPAFALDADPRLLHRPVRVRRCHHRRVRSPRGRGRCRLHHRPRSEAPHRVPVGVVRRCVSVPHHAGHPAVRPTGLASPLVEERF